MKPISNGILHPLSAIVSALAALASICLPADEGPNTIPFDHLGAEAGKDYPPQSVSGASYSLC